MCFGKKLPGPVDYNLNPETTTIQVLTEFFAPPMPRKFSQTNEGIADDAILDFGDLTIGIGQAFLARAQGESITAGTVRKHWEKIENRDFLIERNPSCASSRLSGNNFRPTPLSPGRSRK